MPIKHVHVRYLAGELNGGVKVFRRHGIDDIDRLRLRQGRAWTL